MRQSPDAPGVAAWPADDAQLGEDPERPVEGPGPVARRQAVRRWRFKLLGVSLGGLVVRTAYVLAYRRRAPATGDAYFYHYQANLLAAGRVFINPYTYNFTGHAVAAADHPPLWTLVLALASVVGVKTFFGQILWSCVVGAMAVALVGIAGHEVAGPGAGLAAAVLAALYPVFWINDGALMSETLVLVTTALVVWAFYRLWRRPSWWRAGILGMACALAALTRSEMLLVLPAAALGAGLLTRTRGARRRLGLALATLAGAVLVLSPWWVFNIPRFKDPVLLSSELGLTLATANCPATYSGPRIGYWSFSCGLAVHTTKGADPSQQDVEYRQAALAFAEHHVGQLPAVLAARLGRELGVFRPFQQIDFEWMALGRPRLPATIGLFVYYACALAAIGGAVLLRLRRVPILPFVVIALDVALVAMAAFGQTRYRASLDGAIVILAGVAVDGICRRWTGARTRRPLPGPPAGAASFTEGSEANPG